MTPALRGAAMTAILMFHCEEQPHKTVPTNRNRFEEKGESKRNRAEAIRFSNLTPVSYTHLRAHET